MVRNFDGYAPGAKKKKAEPGAKNDGETQPNVVGHEDEHEPVGYSELHDV